MKKFNLNIDNNQISPADQGGNCDFANPANYNYIQDPKDDGFVNVLKNIIF